MFLNLDSLQTNMNSYYAIRHKENNLSRSALAGKRYATSNPDGSNEDEDAIIITQINP